MNLTIHPTKNCWLIDAHAEAKETEGPGDGNERHPIAVPNECGEGYFNVLNLAYETTFIRSIHKFKPSSFGHLIPFGECRMDYEGPTFFAQVMRRGSACHREFSQEANLSFEEGKDLFAHSDRRHGILMMNGTPESEMMSLCMKISSVEALLGEAETDQLLRALDIHGMPAFSVRSMPKSIGDLLHLALREPLKGTAKRLHAQMMALEYLSALFKHLSPMGATHAQTQLDKGRARALYAHLLDLEGKIPTLEQLARRFECSARRLNADFVEVYGESINAFITGHRLAQARTALLQSDVPMKALADRLGYTHVNNFIIAFKRRFGVSPGSMRRA